MNRPMDRAATEARDQPIRSGASVEEIESRLESDRKAIESTLNQIEQRMSTEGMARTAMDYLRSDSGTRFLHGLRDSVVNNPLPVTLVGIGVLWTAYAERTGRRTGLPASSSTGGTGQKATQKLQGMRERGRDAAGRGREMAERSRESLGSARERAGELRRTAGERSRYSVERTRELSREHPVALAGAGLALGAALAAMFPTTRAEEEHLGPAAERAREKAREKAREAEGGTRSAERRETDTGQRSSSEFR